MDLAKTRQLLLVALSSTSPGESHNALSAIKTLLTKASKDIHWLAQSLGSSTTATDPQKLINHQLNAELTIVSRQRDAAISENNRLRQEIMLLRIQSSSQALPPGDQFEKWVKGMGMTPQQMAREILARVTHRLTTKEADFLEHLVVWKGTPTDKQLAWLEALWEKYG